MRNNRFQNRVSKSPFTLPLCIVLGLLVWFCNASFKGFDFAWGTLVGWFMAVGVTCVGIETSRRFSILRVRSNMIASVWVVMVAMMPQVHGFSAGWVATLSLACSYHVMFYAYQQHEPVVAVFHTFVLLGIACLAVPHMMVLVPLYYWYLLVFLRCLSWRGFWAGIVGLALPVCFVLGWSIAMGDYAFLYSRAKDLSMTPWIVGQDYSWLLEYNSTKTLVLCFAALLISVGVVHYINNYYNDKIRTRMYLYIYVIQTMALALLIMCMPGKMEMLYPLMMLGGSVMIAHFFALTGSWISNAFFCLVMVALVCLLILNFGIWKF